jgi:hypothetical protein
MRKKALSLALGMVVVVALAAPAGAGRASSASASITAVRAVLVTTGVDSCGAYCEYQARVTMSWNGTIRLWVSQLVDGARQAPAERRLTGSGKNVTIVVSGIRGEPGQGPLVAEAQVLVRTSWVVFTSYASEPVTCVAS